MRSDPRAAPAALPDGSAAGASPVVVWAFYVFVASLPFEYPNRTLPVETTTLTGAVLLLASLGQPQLCFRRPPTAFWLFVAYMYAVLVSFVFTGAEYPRDTVVALVTRAQLLLIFLVAYNLAQDPRTARRALTILAISCAVLAALTLTGVVGMEEVGASTRRITALGQNPNRAARILMGGLLAALGLAFGGARPPFRPRLLALAIAGLTGAAMLATGSRGGILALAVGLWILTLGGRGWAVRARNAVVSLVAIAALGYAALQSPLMRTRLERAQRGDLAGREEIFPTAWQMIGERPLLGWGTGGNSYELAMRISDGVHVSRDTHNLLLELLTSTGLLGTLPFLSAVAWCLLVAWRARLGPLGITPFAMGAAILAGNVSGNYIALKLLWFVLAVAIASGRLVPAPAAVAPSPAPQRRRWSPPVVGRPDSRP